MNEVTKNIKSLSDVDFITFLIDNDIYDRFVNNVLEYKLSNPEKTGIWSNVKGFFSSKSRKKYIENGFDWNDTPEGELFWGGWNYKWKNSL